MLNEKGIVDRNKTGISNIKLKKWLFMSIGRLKTLTRDEKLKEILDARDPLPLRPHKVKKWKTIFMVRKYLIKKI